MTSQPPLETVAAAGTVTTVLITLGLVSVTLRDVFGRVREQQQ